MGKSHFVQAVNSASFQVWSKTGAVVAGPFSLGSLWSSGPCTFDFTDPTVNYDQLADRWVFSQIASDGGGLCLAISRTGTPGTTAADYFLYEIRTPNFPDYQKIGVWRDGYYVTTYEAPDLGMYVLDRANLLTGNGGTLTITCQASGSQCLRTSVPALGAPGVRDTRMLPADLEGDAPAAGTPGLFLRTVDDQQDPDNPVDRLQIWTATTNWTTQTWTVTAQSDLTPAAFDILVCNRNGDGFRDCIPQPDGTTLDSLSNRPMMAARYRQFGDHASLVFNQTVNVAGAFPIASGEVAGIRWYELRSTGGAWSIFDQGDFSQQNSPATAADLVQRWMGSATMDRSGDIAMGYSAVNSNAAAPLFPAMAYTGRRPTDAAGTMRAEIQVAQSSTSAAVFDHRWGDYSDISVDPVDGCTFWYTTQLAGGETRVANFRFTECSPPSLPVCVLAEGNLLLKDRSVLTAETAAGSFLQLARPGRINGNGRSGGNAQLGNNSVITGNLTLQGTLSREGTITIGGVLIENDSPTIPTLQTKTFPVGSGSQSIAPRTNATLTPGNRGNFSIGAGANVTLNAGTYNFASLTVEPDANLIINGAVVINVQNSVSYGDRCDVLGGGSLTLYSNGTLVRVGTDATFRGILSAPNANLTVAARTAFTGCVGGQNVTFEEDSRLTSGGLTVPVNP